MEETVYWLELLGDTAILKKALLKNLLAECDELLSIMVKSVKNIKERKNKDA